MHLPGDTVTVRARYTYRVKARHLTTLARMTADSIRPVLALAIPTARLILTRRYIDPKDDR